MKVKLIGLIALITIFSVLTAFAEVSLTVYQRDLLLVNDTRTVDVKKGLNTIIFDKIAPGIFESTLRISPVEGLSGIETIEQSYEYDLADQDRIWRKYIGEEFSFTKDDSLYEGVLLRFDDDVIYLELKGQHGSITLIERSGLDDMTFDNLPAGIVLRPEVHWVVKSSKKRSKIKIQISYLTDGMTWQADYNALLMNDSRINLQGNITLTNSLDLDFEDAGIDLIAGDPHRSYDDRTLSGGDKFGTPDTDAQEQDTRFFEYRRYSIPDKTSLHAFQTKGLPFMGPVEVTYQRDFFFDGSAGTGEVMIRLSFDNETKAGLGVALPEGDLLLYEEDKGGKTQFLGEDHLEASSPGDEVELIIGKAFDIRVDRRRVSHQRIARNRTSDVIEIEFTSSRTQISNITVRERLYGFWEIKEATWGDDSIDHRVEHANMVEFDLELPPHQSGTLRYVVEYGY